MLAIHAEIVAAVGHKHIELLERTFVEEHLNTLAGRVLALIVLFVDRLLAAADKYGKSVYGQHLKKVAEGRIVPHKEAM